MPWSVIERDGRFCVVKDGESTPVPGGCHGNRPDAEAMQRALYATENGHTAAIADAFPLDPPISWFTSLPEWFEPGMKLSIATDGPDAGRVAGTVAPRGVFLLDGTGQFRAEDSPTGYEDAMQGDTVTREGPVIKTANLSADLNHVPVAATFGQAVDAMAHTGVALARVRYADVPGYGTVALGAAWPGLSDQQVRKMQASALSGHWAWREEVGSYDMAGAIFVNNPGLPLPRRPTFQPLALAASLPHPPIVGAWLPQEDPSVSMVTHTHAVAPLGAVAAAACPTCGVAAAEPPAAPPAAPEATPGADTVPREEFESLLARVEQIEMAMAEMALAEVDSMAEIASLPVAAAICDPLDEASSATG